MRLTKFEYTKESVGYRCCQNHYGRRVEYIIRPKSEGGRFDATSDESGLCEECYQQLKDVDVIPEIRATKARFAELIMFLQKNQDPEYKQFQVKAYKTRLSLLREMK